MYWRIIIIPYSWKYIVFVIFLEFLQILREKWKVYVR